MKSSMLRWLIPVALIVGGSALTRIKECTYPYWDESATYEATDRVTYENMEFEAKWWTRGDKPDPSEMYGPWNPLGPCRGGTPSTSPTASPSPTPTATGSATPTASPTAAPTGTPGPSDPLLVAYFASWGIYDRAYYLRTAVDNHSMKMLTHVMYAFGNISPSGECISGDSFGDYKRKFEPDQSVDGVGDKWDQPLRGNFNQIRKVKKMYPHVKFVWSFGGWTWSGNFGVAAKTEESASRFAESCFNLLHDPRWDGIWDGIDIDWEYPRACGLECDYSDPDAYNRLMTALRRRFGGDLVTAAITADGTDGGKIDVGGYAAAADKLDFFMPMTYDYFGAFSPLGPTAPHAPLVAYPQIPVKDMNINKAITKLIDLGIPPQKMLFGIGFYGRGWTGVTQEEPGGSARGPAKGEYEEGVDDYKVLKDKDGCLPPGMIGGTAYMLCGSDWWGYDTPTTVELKMKYAAEHDMAGSFAWELSGDTDDAELLTTMKTSMGKLFSRKTMYARCGA